MTLKQKREIVERFKASSYIQDMAAALISSREIYRLSSKCDEVEDVIRDFLNGKFELKPTKMKVKNAK